MQLKPVNKYILIKLLPNLESLIAIPEGSTAPLQKWEVIEVSDVLSPECAQVKVGDLVLIRPGSNILAIDDVAKLGLTNDTSVLAIVTDPPIEFKS